MSSLSKYIASVVSRILSGFTPSGVPATPPTIPSISPSSEEGSVDVFPFRPSNHILMTPSPNLKGTVADAQVSTFTGDPNNTYGSGYSPFHDLSLISDTSTFSSSYSEDDHAILSLSSMPYCTQEADIFSPSRYTTTPPSPPRLIGLGISGIPRKDGKPGAFDGLGRVGIRKSSQLGDHLFTEEIENYDNDGYYLSPTPGGMMQAPDDLSDIFMQELVFTLQQDHSRFLTTIPECDEEDETGDLETCSMQSSLLSEITTPTPMHSDSFDAPSTPSSPCGILVSVAKTKTGITRARLGALGSACRRSTQSSSKINMHRGRTLSRTSNTTDTRSESRDIGHGVRRSRSEGGNANLPSQKGIRVGIWR